MMKRFLSLLLSLMLLAGLAVAQAEEPVVADAEPVVADAEPAAAEADPSAAEDDAAAPQEPVLLVTVNGEEIKSDHEEVDYWINYYLYQLSGSGYDTSNPEMLQMVNQYALLNTMRFIIIRQKAAELGLDQFTDDERAEWDKAARESWEQAVQSYTENVTEESTDDEKAAARADAIATLKSQGYEEETYIAEYIDSEISNQLINRLMAHVSEGMTVEDDEVQTHFNELVEEDKTNYAEDIGSYEFMTQYYQQPSYYTPEGYRSINHILLKVDEALLNTWKDLTARYEEQKAAEESPEETIAPEDAEAAEEPAATEEPATEEPAGTPEPTAEPVTEEMIEAAKQAILESVQPTVDEIMAKLKDGASFDDLILEYGTDPGMQDEARRAAGYAVHKDSVIWDPAFTAGAIALEKVGDVSEPILGQSGVHILHYLREIPGGAVELTDAMKDEIRTELLDQKRNAALNTALDQWLEESSIVYTEAGEAWKLSEDMAEAAEPEEEATIEMQIDEEEPAPEEAPAEAETPAQ